MNGVPDDLGTVDLPSGRAVLLSISGAPGRAWTSSFRNSCKDILQPGGVSVHTTELELTPRSDTADYGHLAVYRTVDLDELGGGAQTGFRDGDELVCREMETAADRWIGVDPYDDPAHLKLVVGEYPVHVVRPLDPAT